VTGISEVTQRSFLTDARLRINRIKLDGGLPQVLHQVAEISAHALATGRVGVWFLHPDKDEFTCDAMFDDADPKANDARPVVKISALPIYCTALVTKRFLAYDDVRAEPEAVEMTAYLEQFGITSMLDAAIFRDGEVVGVVCHEHRGPKRIWQPAERQFAATVADLVTTFVETQARLDAQELEHSLALQLRDARRLEALCRFAAGVSHDLANLMGAVTNGIAVLEKRAAPGDAEVLKLISESAHQGAKLTRQLMALARKEPALPVIAEVSQVLDGLKTLLTPQLAANVTVAWDVDAGLKVWADVTQLQQVLFNLVLNARDAMREGGVVLVRARPSSREGFVAFEVIDTGVGIPPENRDRIFDPFFTTRTEGTGIGLSVAQQFTAMHGGDVRVSSTVGEGSTFTVTWPTGPRPAATELPC
jgi:two-component system, cell cycle sensor histidine kinase and response regulator CckA